VIQEIAAPEAVDLISGASVISGGVTNLPVGFFGITEENADSEPALSRAVIL